MRDRHLRTDGTTPHRRGETETAIAAKHNAHRERVSVQRTEAVAAFYG
jgi:hypothetical protein